MELNKFLGLCRIFNSSANCAVNELLLNLFAFDLITWELRWHICVGNCFRHKICKTCGSFHVTLSRMNEKCEFLRLQEDVNTAITLWINQYLMFCLRLCLVWYWVNQKTDKNNTNAFLDSLRNHQHSVILCRLDGLKLSGWNENTGISTSKPSLCWLVWTLSWWF